MLVQAIFVLGSLCTALAIGIDASLYLLQRYQIQHALFETIRLHTRLHMQPDAFAQDLKTNIENILLPQPLGWPHSWHAEQLSPTEADFELFRDPLLEQSLDWPYAAINNDYQAQQYRQSPPDLASGRTIFSANTLALDFYYAYRPYNPILRALLKHLHSWAQHTYTQHLLSNGLLPIKIHVSHPFSSHPIAWPQSTHLPYYRHTGTHNQTIWHSKNNILMPPLKQPPTESWHAHHPPALETDELTPLSPPVTAPPLNNQWAPPLGHTVPDTVIRCDHPACCSH